MNASNDNKETQRLAARYSSMAELELLRLAKQSSTLTDEAREALRAELSRRGLLALVSDPPVAEKVERPLELVLARAFRDLPEALIAKSVLDSAEIECFLFDKNYIALNWLASNAWRGVKLMVADEDVAEVRELLDQDSPESFEISDSETFTQPRCPVCESMDVAFQELVVPVAFGSFLLNSAVRVTRAAWICHTCRHQWENPDDDLYNGDWLDWRLIHSLWFFNFTVGLVLLGGFFEPVLFLLWFPPTVFSALLLAHYAPPVNSVTLSSQASWPVQATYFSRFSSAFY